MQILANLQKRGHECFASQVSACQDSLATLNRRCIRQLVGILVNVSKISQKGQHQQWRRFILLPHPQ